MKGKTPRAQPRSRRPTEPPGLRCAPRPRAGDLFGGFLRKPAPSFHPAPARGGHREGSHGRHPRPPRTWPGESGAGAGRRRCQQRRLKVRPRSQLRPGVAGAERSCCASASPIPAAPSPLTFFSIRAPVPAATWPSPPAESRPRGRGGCCEQRVSSGCPGERGRQLELSKNESEIAAPAIDRQRGAGTRQPPRAPAASARLISVGSPKRGHHHPVLPWIAGLFGKKWAGGAAASTALIVGCASHEGFGQNPEPSVQGSGGRGLTVVAGG